MPTLRLNWVNGCFSAPGGSRFRFGFQRLFYLARGATALALIPSLLLTSLPGSLYAFEQVSVPAILPVKLAQTEPVVAVNHTVPKVTPPSSTFSLPTPVTTAALASVRLFPEPLVPVGGKPTADQNAALGTALISYASSRNLSVLETYVSGNAGSPWLVSILTNLGLLEFQDGYFSKALADWNQAWTLGKDATSPAAQAVVNRAVAEMLRLEGRVGRVADVKALLAEIKDRTFHGLTANMIRESKQVLVDLEILPKNSYKCGPFALKNILDFLHQHTDQSEATLKDYATTPQGTSLAQVATLAGQVGLKMQVAKRTSGTELPLPAVVNWKLNHYGALLKQNGDRYLLVDPTFGTSEWVLKDAVAQESSGYFLIPAGALPSGWVSVGMAEAGTVWGRGDNPNQDGKSTKPSDPTSSGGGDGPATPPKPGKNPPDDCKGLAAWSFHTMLASLNLRDTPLFYSPPRGPKISFSLNYDALEENQPSTINYSNFGALWNFSWLSTITFDSNDAYLATGGGGTEQYIVSGTSPLTYYPELETSATLVMISATDYERRAPDGSKMVFGLADSSGRLYLTQMVDTQGETLTMTYDANFRLVSLTDALGQVTTLAYGTDTVGAALFYNITKVTDPFGRYASFSYNAQGQLTQITDQIGMNSQFTYGANDFVQSLTTPYGTTTFTYTASSNSTNGNIRSLLATEPGGAQQRLDTVEISTITPASDAAATVPTGMPCANIYLEYRNSYFWDRKAMHDAPGDYTQASLTHFCHLSDLVESGIVESEKEPLENRVWYFYQNQVSSYYVATGMMANPVDIGRVLDDGTTQLYQATYNVQGFKTQSIDPAGRTTNYTYAPNNIDVTAIHQVTATGSDLIGSFTWNDQHCPLTFTGADGENSTFTYNAQGQQLTSTDAKNQVVTATYDANGYLSTVHDPIAGPTDELTFVYDPYGRVQTVTDGGGYVLTFAYDALNRTISTTYPDGTSSQTAYTYLQPTQYTDRLGRITTIVYNSLQQIVSSTDPLNRVSRYSRCTCGEILKLVDPLGQTTSWVYDIESRPLIKTYPDGSQITYTYEKAKDRLKTETDSKQQTKSYSYNIDDNLASTTYYNPQAPTPNVRYTYDSSYDRITSMVDGIGTTSYSYRPVTGSVSLGANQLAEVSGPLNNSNITFTYDELSRILSRSVNGVARTVTYDALGRTPTITDALGTFTYTFLGSTSQIASLTYPNGQSTTVTYLGNTGDRRMQQIKNLNTHGANLSEFDYTSNAVGNILTIDQTNDASPAVNTSFTYDAANQLSGTSTTGQTYGYTYDVAGNRLTQTVNGSASTATYNANNELQQVNPALGNDKTYTWDAENRLVGINYTGSNLTTQLSYDGMNRCSQIVEKNGTTITSTKRFVWNDRDMVEEHDANDNTVRRFLDQGEQVNGTPYFYTGDQLFSIREMTDSAGALHARYSYDPYGTRTKVSGDLDASRAFTGHYYHAPSGLNLTMWRAYDSQTGRWLSRDPLPNAESSQGPNLFEYVADNPIKNVDNFGTDRTLYFYGHTYIKVDTWDKCCKQRTGKRFLDFAPGLGQRSDFRNLDENDPDIKGQFEGISWTINSTCEQDKALVTGWDALATDGTIKYNVYPNNCITIAFTMFTYGIN